MSTLIFSSTPNSTLAKELGLFDWNLLIQHIKQLPYGRNSNREDLSLVLTQKKELVAANMLY